MPTRAASRSLGSTQAVEDGANDGERLLSETRAINSSLALAGLLD
jgi:hypothetical protein